jgi:uncharacterized protein DUF1559
MTHSNDSVQPRAPGASAVARQPGRFTLRELFILTALVCVVAGLYSWGSEHAFAALLLFAAVFATIAFVIHVVARWSLGETIAVMAVLIPLSCLLLPSLGSGPQPARRMQCSNHLKQIAIGLQNYHDVYGSFPPTYIADAKGQPIHSWRVLILPFIEQKALYDKYNFNEPWDGPNNRKLHLEVLDVFCCPSRPKQQPTTETSYVVVMGPQTMWPGANSTSMAGIIDGTSNTLMVVEVANSGIHWMEPRDLHVVQMPMAVNPPKGQGISSAHPHVALCVYADGHTYPLTEHTPPEIIRALLTIAGGETIDDY